MDDGDDELSKSRAELSFTKLWRLHELYVRTGVSAADPHHEDLRCTLFDTDLGSQLLSALGSGTGGTTAAAIAAAATVDSGDGTTAVYTQAFLNAFKCF